MILIVVVDGRGVSAEVEGSVNNIKLCIYMILTPTMTLTSSSTLRIGFGFEMVTTIRDTRQWMMQCGKSDAGEG